MSKILVFLGEFLSTLGNLLTNLGLIIMPFSFLAYLFFKVLEFGNRPPVRYTKFIKIIWIILQFITEFSTERKYNVVIILLILLEVVDTFFEFLEEFVDAQEVKKQTNKKI